MAIPSSPQAVPRLRSRHLSIL